MYESVKNPVKPCVSTIFCPWQKGFGLARHTDSWAHFWYHESMLATIFSTLPHSVETESHSLLKDMLNDDIYIRFQNMPKVNVCHSCVVRCHVSYVCHNTQSVSKSVITHSVL